MSTKKDSVLLLLLLGLCHVRVVRAGGGGCQVSATWDSRYRSFAPCCCFFLLAALLQAARRTGTAGELPRARAQLDSYLLATILSLLFRCCPSATPLLLCCSSYPSVVPLLLDCCSSATLHCCCCATLRWLLLIRAVPAPTVPLSRSAATPLLLRYCC